MDENEIVRSIGRLEGKMDLLITMHTARLDGAEKRLGSVEKRVWYGSGLSAIVAILLAKVGLPPLHI